MRNPSPASTTLSSMDDVSIRDQNRRAWNSIADRRDEVRGFPPPEVFSGGGSTLDQIEMEALPPVAGRAVLHLGCASGSDTLSLAGLGARVTGVDISDVAIELARAKAHRAGLEAEFIRADIFDLPDGLDGEFDVVYVKAGVLCWMSDIRAWALIVARVLRRGGTLLVYEMHPLLEVIEVIDSAIKVDWNYFGRKSDLVDTPTMTGVETTEPRYQFTWPLGDVVTAVLEAGLALERLQEFPGKEPPLDKLPCAYLLRASKAAD